MANDKVNIPERVGKNRSYESVAGQRAFKFPYECRVKFQTLTGPHRRGTDGHCVSCRFPFRTSTLPIPYVDPLSGHKMAGIA